MKTLGYTPFDCDNHYYEAFDAFTRHVPREWQKRCVQWCDIDGRKYHLVGGEVSKAVSNPTWDPIAKPGALHEYFRGNPTGRSPLEMLKDREPLPGEYMDRDLRVKKIKELLPRIGKVQHIESNRLNWGRYQKKISTLHSLAPHDVSIIHYLLGYHEFKDIVSIGDNFSNNTQNDRDEYSFICNDVSVKFNLSWYYPEKIRTMCITGDKGILFWDEETKTVKLTTDIWQDGRMNYEPTLEIYNIDSNPLRNELNEFVECVTSKKRPLTDVENAIQVASNLELLSKSLAILKEVLDSISFFKAGMSNFISTLLIFI